MKGMVYNGGSRAEYEILLCREFDNDNGSGNALWAFGSRVDYVVLKFNAHG